MYNVTEDFKRDIFATSRRFDIEVKIGERIFDKESVSSVKFEGGVQPREYFELGSTVSTTVKLELFTNEPITDTDEISIWIALWVERKVNGVVIHEWEWVPMGHFFIDELEEPERGTISITACDAMVKTEIAFTGKDYVTLRDVARLVTTQTGIAFADEISAEKVSTLLTEYSVRGVLSFIASMMGGFMTINRSGQFKVVKPLAKSVGVVNGDCYFTSKPEKTAFTIGKITCVLGTNDDGKEQKLEAGVLESGTKEIQFENPWMTQRVLDSIYKEYTGFQYSGYTLDLQGNPSFDACDIVILKDTSGIQYDLPIFWWTLEFNGGLSGTLSAKGATELKNSFDSKGSGQKELEKVVAQQGVFNELTAETLKVHSGMFDEIKAGTGEFENLYVKYAEFEKMVGDTLIVKNAVIDIANIESLLAGNVTSGNVTTITLNSLNSVVERSFVVDQIAKNLYVDDLLAGDISTNRFRIVSDDGGIVISGATQQWYDKNKNVRMQAGRDASDNFTFALFDESGTGILIDHRGIHEKAIPDQIIVDSMISDEANINGEKIDIKSLVKEVNGSSETIKSSKILYDPTGQSLEIAFGSLKKDYDQFTTVTYDAFVKATNTSLEARYNETHMVVDGKEVTVKDRYTQVVESANGLSVKVNNHESTLYSDGTGLVDRVSSAELNLEPDKIVAKVQSGIKDGAKIETTKFTFDNTGLSIRGGGITIQNNAGDRVLYGDTSGNLLMKGSFEQYASSGFKSIDIKDNSINIYAWASSSNYVGSVRSSLIEGMTNMVISYDIGDRLSLVNSAVGETGLVQVSLDSSGFNLHCDISNKYGTRYNTFIGTDYIYQMRLAGNPNWYIHCDTNIGAYGINIWASDGRMKANIQPTQVSALDEIARFKHRAFQWKDGGKFEKIGYIAQEVEQIDPDYVERIPQKDMNGNVLDYRLQINEHRIIPLLTKAVQELSDQNTELQRQIAYILEKIDFGNVPVPISREVVVSEEISQYPESIRYYTPPEPVEQKMPW